MSEYIQNWREYRSLRRQLLFVWLGYVPAVGLFTLAEQQLWRTFAPCFCFDGAWLLWFLVSGIRFNRFACPRCGNTFAGTWWYNLSYFARKCQHCGLGKFEEEQPNPLTHTC